MTHSELTEGVWTIPGSRTKNSRTHSLMLPPLAQQIIRQLPVIQSCPFVFTTNGRTPGQWVLSCKEAAQRSHGSTSSLGAA